MGSSQRSPRIMHAWERMRTLWKEFVHLRNKSCIYKYVAVSYIVEANLSEPHTSETLVLSTIHKKLRIKIRELTNAPIFVRVIDHATAE